MKFINNLSELEGMCCDRIVAHDDILLQHLQDTQFAHIHSISPTVTAFRIDTGASIGNVTSDYEVLATVQSNGKLLITVKSKRMSSELCDIRCFYLRVQITGRWDTGGGLTIDTPLFDKYTSCFKVEDCCIVPSGISVQSIVATT